MHEGRIVGAENQGTIFRGFEIMLEGRDPYDAPYLTQRICGICSSAYALAACRALEDMAEVTPPDNALLARNIILGLDTLQNHLRQFYMLYLWDWVAPPPQNPFQGGYTKDFRLNDKLTARFREHYWAGVDQARQAHEALTLLGGKIPHTHGIVPGGVSLVPSGELAGELGQRVEKIQHFIKECYLPDTLLLKEHYPDYMQIGTGSASYLSHGLFSDPGRGDIYPAGVVLDGRKEEADLGEIEENLAYSYYRGADGGPREGTTEPDPDRQGAYSWIKAPRYRGFPCQGGPLARKVVRGEPPPAGNSVMERLIARAEEALEISSLIGLWLARIEPGKPGLTDFEKPVTGTSIGTTEAMRGPLSHWVTLKEGRIRRYQIIAPSSWNFSPRDGREVPGPAEEALLGSPVEDISQPVEVGRVIRSFDPCYACTAHVLDLTRGLKAEARFLC